MALLLYSQHVCVERIEMIKTNHKKKKEFTEEKKSKWI